MASTSKKIKLTEMKKKLNLLIVEDNHPKELKIHEWTIESTVEGISKTTAKINGEEAVISIEVITKTARNGVEAVNIHPVDGASFDLILMDMMKMPVRDGVSATKKLKEMNVESVIVGMTSAADKLEEEKRRAFMEAGLDGCLEKALTKAKILPFIKKVMDSWVFV